MSKNTQPPLYEAKNMSASPHDDLSNRCHSFDKLFFPITSGSMVLLPPSHKPPKKEQMFWEKPVDPFRSGLDFCRTPQLDITSLIFEPGGKKK